MAKRVFTPEFKREAVRLASKPGISKAQAAREVGVHANVLGAWQAKFKSGKWDGVEVRIQYMSEARKVGQAGGPAETTTAPHPER